MLKSPIKVGDKIKKKASIFPKFTNKQTGL
jgi:hypothetical protein